MGKGRLVYHLTIDKGIYLRLKMCPTGAVSLILMYRWGVRNYMHRSHSRTLWRLECWKT